ncbi:MAG: alpha/beta hydrolase [Planctomycetota bacterium]|nr:alpha/beta hydrolase [Planctomycetota bacterium]
MRADLHCLSRSVGPEEPTGWILILHGILGSGSNWGAFGRELCERRPDFGVLIPDHRLHGKSGNGAPPDDVEACVLDLEKLISVQSCPPSCVMGHSFGSKMALELATKIPEIRQCIILDADPAPLQMTGHSRKEFPVLLLMDALRKGPEIYLSREAFVEELAQSGFRQGIAGWVGKNLKRVDGGLKLNLDLDRVESLLDDHHRLDYWPHIDGCDLERIDFVVGARSNVVSAESLLRMKTTAEKDPERSCFTSISEAGHWLHVDRPTELLEAILPRLLDPEKSD